MKRSMLPALALAMLATPPDRPQQRPRPKSLLRSRSGPRQWTGKHDQERERRRRQLERGMIQKTREAPHV